MSAGTVSAVRQYLVTLSTPKGQAELEVPTTLGAEAAGRRAWAVGLAQGWGDVDEVQVVSVEDITTEEQ